MASRNSFGLKVAQPGVPAEFAGDFQLLYSSSWPVLRYTKQLPIKTGQSTAQLNSSYIPFLIAYFTSTTGGRDYSQWVMSNTSYSFTKDVITLDSAASSDWMFYAYNLDITKNYKAPIVKGGTAVAQGYDADFGIKLVREGKDIDSHDLRDFILHSRSISPLIHSVTYQDNPSATFSVTYDLDYVPVCFAFYRSTDNTWRSIASSPTSANFRFDRDKVAKTVSIKNINTANVNAAAIVILKNPFFLRDMKKVSYSG